jgi:hypothetical protein
MKRLTMRVRSSMARLQKDDARSMSANRGGVLGFVFREIQIPFTRRSPCGDSRQVKAWPPKRESVQVASPFR